MDFCAQSFEQGLAETEVKIRDDLERSYIKAEDLIRHGKTFEPGRIGFSLMITIKPNHSKKRQQVSLKPLRQNGKSYLMRRYDL